MDNMADENVTGTDAGSDAGGVDAFEREFEAARAEQSGPAEGIGQEQAEGEQGDQEAAERAQQQERKPLPPEEITKRWTESKAALREERRARQDLERQLAELRTKVEGGGQQKAAEQEQGPPDLNEDPLGALEWLQKRIEANDAREAEQKQQQEARQREAAETQALARDFQASEAEFREENPDYDDAVKHLRTARVQELMLFGYSEADAISLFADEVFATLRDVKAKGLNPAQVAYGLAKQRGYQPGGKKAAESAGGDALLDTIAKGQAASKTLSGSGGKGNGELTVESVSNLKGAAFDAAFEKLMKQEREREKRLN